MAALTPEEWYTWDVSGYIVVRNVLEPSLLRTLSSGPTLPLADGFGEALQGLDAVNAVLDQLFGEPEGESQQVGYVLPAKQHNFRHQRQPELLLSPADKSGGGLVLENRDARRVYYNERLVNTPFPDEAGLPRGVLMGVHAFIALDDTQTLAVVPATHQSSTPLPPGHEPPLLPLPLRAGDLAIIPSNLLYSLRPHTGDAPSRSTP